MEAHCSLEGLSKRLLFAETTRAASERESILRTEAKWQKCLFSRFPIVNWINSVRLSSDQKSTDCFYSCTTPSLSFELDQKQLFWASDGTSNRIQQVLESCWKAFEVTKLCCETVSFFSYRSLGTRIDVIAFVQCAMCSSAAPPLMLALNFTYQKCSLFFSAIIQFVLALNIIQLNQRCDWGPSIPFGQCKCIFMEKNNFQRNANDTSPYTYHC